MAILSSFKVTVEPVMFFYMMATFMYFPALQALIYRKVCITHYNVTFCDQLNNKSAVNNSLYHEEEDFVQTKTSYWILIGNICLALPSAIVVLAVLSPIADKVSRKAAILTVTVFAILGSICSLINGYYIDWPPSLVLLGAFMNGLGGGYIGMMMAIYSYVTYIAKLEDRNVRVAITEAMVFLSGTIGVFCSGLMVDRLGFIATFGFVVGLYVIIGLYVVVLLPDVKGNVAQENETVNCFAVVCNRIYDIIEFVKKKRGKEVTLRLALFIFILLLLMVCFSGELDIFYLYVTRKPLKWSATMYGYLRGLENFMRGISLILILPLLKYKLHLRDTTLILLGLVSRIATYILFSFRSTVTLFCGAVVSAFSGFPAAGIRATTSKMVDNSEHGRLFGLIATLESLSSIVATLVFNEVYPVSLTFYAGFCFILMAVILAIALLFMIWLHRNTAPINHYANVELTESPSSSSENLS